MNETLKKYSNRDVPWSVYADKALAAGKESRKVAVIVFENDSKESEATLKAFEDRTLAKLHEKCVFVRITFRKDSDEARLWGVTTAPTVLIADPAKDAGAKSVIDRSSGKKAPASLKNMVLKGLKALEKDAPKGGGS